MTNEWDYFLQTDTIFLMTYYRFLSQGDTVVVTIKRPNSSVWSNWTWINNFGDFNAAYIYWWMIAGTGEPNGTWTFQADYKNQSYTDPFILGTVGVNESEDNNIISFFPNPSDGNLFVKSSDATVLSRYYLFTISNLMGEKVFTSKISSANIQAKLASGMDFYSVTDENKNPVRSGKLIFK